MGFWKVVGCVVGGAVAVIAAPIVLPAVAAAGAVAAAAAASTAVGGAVIGAAAAVGTAAAAVGTAAASTAVGGAVVGAATAVATAATAAGTVVAGTAAGTAIAGAAAGAVTSTVGIIGTGGVSAVIGAGLTYSGITAGEGFSNMSEAKEKIDRAKSIYSKKSAKLEESKKATSLKIDKLNLYKMEIYSKDIEESIQIIKNIKIPKETEVDFTEKDITYLFEKNEINEIQNNSIKTREVLSQTVNGASFMKAAAGGSFGFMSTFGVSSTGTAISSLSGAAAKKATLAALGGGSLQAGGGGIALGSTVLGGLTVVPTAMILSLQYAKKSEETLTEASKYYSIVRKEAGNMEAMILFLQNGVDKRLSEIESTIIRVVTIYRLKIFPKLKNAYDRNKNSEGKVNYKECSMGDKSIIKMSAYFLRKMKDIISVKVLDSNNNITKESGDILQSINNDKKIIGV
ncbi:hypothetical protein K9O30_06615 [Clostridium bowmanii]|uniref:hypothetical protein n=1 Tax=Clostridium bowmanii TaxID=132925 RepID=UPI001C0CFC51|nr:hypothetical protein [Clostridium bowmanii]MBU3191295.1 hypothetical protein [Clostridium bowmanii]MCA1073412.1 hypothetical protein [Clostridium bowmanii]